MSPRLDAALAYAERGWPVFPVRAGTKRPATARGFHDATLDRERIEPWWRAHPGDNVGIATGAARLLVVDLDTGGAEHCGDALGALCALATGRGDLPLTYEVLTPSGGEHWYYAVPDDVHPPPCSTGRLAPHVDVRCAGGYVVGAGSELPNGAYAVGRDDVVADAPGWLLHACGRPGPVASETSMGCPSKGTADRYGETAILAECGRVAIAPEGTRNGALNRAAFALGQLVAGRVLDGHEVVGQLLTAAARCGLGQREAERTISSGLAAGQRLPRTRAA